MKLNKCILRVLIIPFLILAASYVSAEEIIKDQAKCFTTWDDQYFYCAFKVDCPNVRSVHNKPNAPVAGDDAVEVFIETDNTRSDKITPSCFSMAVSAAQGAQFKAGTPDGRLEQVNVFSYKYGATVQGTLNNEDDVDMGYMVEMAIPWNVLKRSAPKIGDMMSFNVLIHRHGENSSEFVSLSPHVKTVDDVNNPSKWVNIVFTAHSFVVATTSIEKIISAKYVARTPLINGTILDKEWHANTAFFIDLPMKDGFAYEAKFPLQKMTLTPYFYWYQADQRKGIPLSQISSQDGRITLLDFPLGNAGPWLSYDRVEWHKKQLFEAASAGIDAVLPVYWGDKGNRAGFANKGLDCLVSAIYELRTEGKRYPLVGMFLDTTSFIAAYKTKPDLKQEEVKRSLYGMIKSFFDRVPEELCATAPASGAKIGQPGNIIFLHSCSAFSDLDSTFIEYCNERFEKDFGRPLVWIGAEDYKGKVNGFDGFSTHGPVGSLRYDNSGRIRIGCVGAGYDNSSVAADAKPIIISRAGGETYEKDWNAVLEKEPHWVLADCWNGFLTGSELCSSREYGQKYADMTRAYVAKFHAAGEFDAQFIRCNVPSVISPKQIAQAEVMIRNMGASPWRASEGIALGYRWYKNGRFYGDSKVRIPISRDVMPGETITMTIGIAPVNSVGVVIPDGKCELRFEMIRLSDGKWFSMLGDQPYYVPINVGTPPQAAATYLSCNAPVLMASGFDYPVTIRVRNDGNTVWKKGVAKLGCRLFKISNYIHGEPDDFSEEVPIKDVRALLTKDCKPGEIAEFSLALNIAQPNNKPIPSWKQDYSWSYQLRFDIYDGQSWLSESGVRTLNRVVDIYESDYAPRIVDCDIPRKLEAGKVVECRIVLRNTGRHTWDKKRTKIGYHWYHLDGSEMQWDTEPMPIKANILPGMAMVVSASVRTPEYDGRYVLAWDIMIDDVWQSTQPISRGGDILPVRVEVYGGRLAFVDLSNYADTVAASPDTDRSRGDFDGRGCSFPEELYIADALMGDDGASIYPSGYNYSISPVAPGRISFLITKNGAVSCKGNKILIPNGNYSALYILGASSGENVVDKFSINYSDGAAVHELAISSWSSGPGNNEKVGYFTRHRHSHGGDEAGQNCYLYQYKIPLVPGRSLTSITLPNNPNIKIVGITLEK